MSKLHLVFGGRVKDPRTLDFDLKSIDLVGVYDSFAAGAVVFLPKPFTTAQLQIMLQMLIGKGGA